MSNHRNEQRDRALQALVARYETTTTDQESVFLSEEEFEELLSHYYGKHDFDRTLQVADHAISQHNFTPEFYKWKALIHKINLQEDDAMEALEKLSIYAPNDEESLMLRLEVLIHFEHKEAAREALERLQNRVEGDVKQSLLAFFDGLLLLQETRYNEAWDAFSEAMRLDAYQEPALDELLNASELEHLRPRLAKRFRQELEKDPFNDLVWYYFGLWHDDREDDFKAMDAFANARSLAPENPRYDLEYADKLFDLERFEQALKVYSAYFESPEAEDHYETYMRMGRSYQLLKRLEEAKACFFRAAELAPDMYDIYQHLGECFVTEEKWGVAAYNYGRAVEQKGHSADCWLGLALCHSAMNDAPEAEKAFAQAVTMETRFSDAHISFALFLCDQGRETQAITYLEETLEEYQDASLLFGTVAVNLVCNRRKQALIYLNDALAKHYEDQHLLLEWYPDLRQDPEINAIFELHKP